VAEVEFIALLRRWKVRFYVLPVVACDLGLHQKVKSVGRMVVDKRSQIWWLGQLQATPARKFSKDAALVIGTHSNMIQFLDQWVYSLAFANNKSHPTERHNENIVS